MASTFAATPTIGINFGSTDPTPSFAVGTPVLGNQNDTWVYVKASGTVATGVCGVDASFNVTDAGTGYTSPVVFASGEYGWVTKTVSPL